LSEESSEKPDQKRVLALRERHKAKKPHFRREESWRYKRVSQIWRKADGTDSKMRKHKKGWPKSVEVGYRGPKVARGLHPSGYFEVPVRTIDDLSKVDRKTHAIRIAHTVGMKKRAEISLRATEMGLHILNPLPEVKPEEAAEEETMKKTESADAEAEVEDETKETKEKEGKEEEKTS